MDNAQCHGLAVQTSIVEEGYRHLKTSPIERMSSRMKSYVSRGTRAGGDELVARIKEGMGSVTEQHSRSYRPPFLS